ncbi:ABC transporter permease [Pararhodobacter sp. SW119]|uniref:FtsX-like permease family protein n=1 Tax=Pararhodobacter sp. SW119 TaxID=2780075 RepID=UPI001ADF7898|nr:ABC transporter permease [Pararhodobacter sp. SW119]
MTRAALSALLSHWRRHPLQLAMLLAGLALATALWSGVQALNAEARASYDRAGAFLAEADLARLEAPAGLIDQADYIALRRAGWQVSPVLEGRVDLGASRVTLLGVEPMTAPPGAVAADLTGADPVAFMSAPGQGFAAPETIRAVGDAPFELIEAPEVPVGQVLVDIGLAQALLGLEGQVGRLVLLPNQPLGLPPLNEIAPHLQRVDPETETDLAALTDSFHLNLTAFGLLAFAVGLFIVHAAVGLAFEQRRGVFRTMRALGLPLGRLMALLAAEMLIMGLLAGTVGLVLGYLVAGVLLPDVAATLRGLYGAPVSGTLQFRPAWAAAGLAMALAGVLVAGGQGLWQLARLPVLAPARPRAWARASGRGMRVQGVAATGLALLAGALVVIGDGLIAGFVLLAALLLAAALFVPLVLAAICALGERWARGPVAQWFWADGRQNLPRLSLALMALMLALAANIGVGTMVSSFRTTFVGWLDQRLVAEFYVTARTEAEAEALRAALAPRTDAVLPVWFAEATIAGLPARLYGTADHATFRDHWPLIAEAPGAWDRLAAGEGVMINEQLARAADLWPGDTVDLPGAGRLAVAGVYSDYGNPRAQVMLGIDAFLAAFPQAPRLSHAVRMDAAEVPALMADLQDDLGLPHTLMSDQAQAKAVSLQIFERTFVVTGALNILTLSVAALALFASLVTLSGMRLAQLAPLWALGLTRRRLAALDLARGMVLAGLTAVLALPVGLMLAQVLLAVINVQAFGWRLPMQVFPADWARLGAWALLAALVACALPALRLARSAPADLIRVFAHER